MTVDLISNSELYGRYSPVKFATVNPSIPLFKANNRNTRAMCEICIK